MRPAAVCQASPSLALLKYWGKRDPVLNIPATTSIAVALEGLRSTTRVRVMAPQEGPDRVLVNGEEQPEGRYEKFFEAVRGMLHEQIHFEAESMNNFPTAAGLASSSSGFAALALAAVRAAGKELPLRTISALARVGSASAARAVFGGFTLLPAGAVSARQLYDAEYWPELRIIVCVVRQDRKEVSSRGAMEISRLSSPFYRAWVRSSARLVPRALRALELHDIEELGDAMRLSYLRMFATILSSDPPTLYWRPESVELLNECEEMRSEGLAVWETMDAGPQVKLLCLEESVEEIRQRISQLGFVSQTIECAIGGAPVCTLEEAPE